MKVYVFFITLLLLFTVNEVTGKKKKPATPVKPFQRIRREWRTLSAETKQKVANAFWIVKNTPTQLGRVKYGPNFNNHDEMLILHSCAVMDPRCDNGHFGPSFMTFHRAFLLKYELSLLAVDPSIGALPYWNIANDAVNGKYRNDPSMYIFTDNFFGDFWTKQEDSYAVTNGLFAYWPIAQFASNTFGKTSSIAPGNRCILEEWFSPYSCNKSDSSSPKYLRTHSDCTPYTSRNPYNGINGVEKGLGGSYEIVFTEKDFNTCTNNQYIKNWMDWQNCIEIGSAACNPRFVASVQKNGLPDIRGFKPDGNEALRLSLAELASDIMQGIQETKNLSWSNFTCQNANIQGSYVAKKKVQFVNFFHSLAHVKFGLDLLDVTTSPNDPGAFTGYHAYIDSSNMIWQKKTAKMLSKSYWGYPKTLNDLGARGQSIATISGPYSTYALGMCGNDNQTFSEYRPFGSAWLPGTTLDDVVNSGFAFKNLFNCTTDVVDQSGHLIRCSGGQNGYTHRELLYWTSPERSPYIYDIML